MSPLELWSKALAAAASAHALLARGDANGATSRAYYAMFNAARSVLWLSDEIDPAAIKKHASVFRLFSERFVKSGRLSAEIGQLLTKAAEARFIADYDEIDVSLSSAQRNIEAMDQFLQALGAWKENRG